MAKSCLNCKHWKDRRCDNEMSGYFMYDAEEIDVDACGNWEGHEDNINHPSHYQGRHECIDVMIAVFGEHSVMEFCRCNIFKYRFRAGAKNGEEDIKKAEWYEAKLMELQDKRNNKPNSF